MPDPNSLLALHDLHLPEPMGFWPPAIGWWVVILILIASLGLLYHYLRSRIKTKRPTRFALLELDQIYASNQTKLEKIQQISILLRRYVLTRFEREQVAGLCGRSWLRFLDSRLSGKHFTHGVGQLLTTAPYRSQQDKIDLISVYDLVHRWIAYEGAQQIQQGNSKYV